MMFFGPLLAFSLALAQAEPASIDLQNMAHRLGPHAKQLLWVTHTDGSPLQVIVQMLEKNGDKWSIKQTFPAVIGSAGFADANGKVEGDKKTPTGVYPIGQVWGKASSFTTHMPYRQVTTDDKFVDDPSSPEYNSWVHGQTKAKSFEEMFRTDGIYDIGAVLEYNMHPAVPGKGSAIFLHIWRSSTTGTTGCVALEKPNVEEILHWLNPAAGPLIVLNPR